MECDVTCVGQRSAAARCRNLRHGRGPAIGLRGHVVIVAMTDAAYAQRERQPPVARWSVVCRRSYSRRLAQLCDVVRFSIAAMGHGLLGLGATHSSFLPSQHARRHCIPSACSAFSTQQRVRHDSLTIYPGIQLHVAPTAGRAVISVASAEMRP